MDSREAGTPAPQRPQWPAADRQGAPHRVHRPSARRQRRLRRSMTRAALMGLVRGAATAFGTLLAGWLTSWAREHL